MMRRCSVHEAARRASVALGGAGKGKFISSHKNLLILNEFCVRSQALQGQARTMKRRLSAPPSGRRRITDAQLKATAGLTGIYAAVEKSEVLGAFKKAAPALGTSRRLVDFIDLLMSRTFPADWTGEWRPVVWPSNDWLADRLGLEISRVKELIRAAIDAGLMLPVDSGTRKRYGKRAKPGGRILYAYGFDLSPLAERLPAFQRAAAEHEARRQEGLALRRDISHLRAAILGLTDYAEAEELSGQDWPARALTARDVAAKARYLRDPFALRSRMMAWTVAYDGAARFFSLAISMVWR
jgi:replication initiation protein RepC